jgi:hypothetical protein
MTVTITIIIKPRDDNAIDGEYWQHAWIYIFIYTIHFTCSLPLRVSLVSGFGCQQRRRRRPSAARSPALRCAALLCLLALSRGCQRGSQPASASNHPTSILPTRPIPTHFAIAITLPSPIHPPSLHPSAIAASLRQHHLRLCVPSPCIPIHPKSRLPLQGVALHL